MQNLKLTFVRIFLIGLIIAVSVAIIYGLEAYNNKVSPDLGTYEVTQVFDGDTIEVKMDGKRYKVRFIGVDTPETGGNGTDMECYGKEATNFTKEILTGKRVRLEADPLSSNTDRYDRLLRYIYRADDDYDVNLQLIQQGFSGKYNVFPHSRSDEFKNASEQAQMDNAGLWSACDY